MNKKLIALAFAGAFAAPAAMADSGNVTLYGQANVSYDLVDSGDGGVPVVQGTRANKVSSNASRIGLKGSEDLGGGLSAVWQIETLVSIDGAAGDTLATRNTFAGLSGSDWGTLVLGRHDTPYKISTRRLDVFADTIADNRSLMGSINGAAGGAALSHDTRTTDTVAYISPSMSGFSAAVAYVAGAENATSSTNTKGSAWSLAGMYEAGPLYAALAYQTVDEGTAGTGPALFTTGAVDTKAKAWKLGASYKMDAFEGSIAYEKLTDDFGALKADAFGHNNWYLAGKYSFGNDAVKLAYTKSGNLPAATCATGCGAKQISLGYDHNFSKRTQFYALYTKLSNDLGTAYALANASFSTGGVTARSDADLSAWSFGLKHSF